MSCDGGGLDVNNAKTLDVEDLLHVSVLYADDVDQDELVQVGQPIPKETLKMNGDEMKRWFGHTKFGCMGSPLVTHFEPAVTCEHHCAYCYVNGYPCRGRRKPSQAMSSDRFCVVHVARLKARKMLALYGRMANGSARSGLWDGMTPEMHMSISTDCLQPDVEVQEKSLLVMRVWLDEGLLLSIVSKGIPLTDNLRTRMLELFREHKDRVSFQVTCASVDQAAQKLWEPGAPPPHERLHWLADIVATGIARPSLRMNPLVPGINDSEAQLAETVRGAAKTGVKRIAVSYMYASRAILYEMSANGVDVFNAFDKEQSKIRGGAPKLHVSKEKRFAAHLIVTKAAAAAGIAVTSCGCDNTDIYPLNEQKCGICWRSST